jgi:hypothetical protein
MVGSLPATTRNGHHLLAGREGSPVGYLRLTPADYRTIAEVCASLDLRGHHLPDFRRYLVECLERTAQGLAERVRGFTDEQVRVLLRHLRQQRQADDPLPLSAWEVGVLADACRQLIGHDRFLGPLKVAFVRALWPACPSLAARLERLNDREFERLWEEIRRRAGRE